MVLGSVGAGDADIEENNDVNDIIFIHLGQHHLS
jgi:hypothetical protein